MIERRGGSWRARYRGPDGRERSKSFKRKSNAERWLVHQRSLRARGDWTDPARGRITFGEYAEARQSVFVMSAALDHAVRSGRIRSNPARSLVCPGSSAVITSTSPTPRF